MRFAASLFLVAVGASGALAGPSGAEPALFPLPDLFAASSSPGDPSGDGKIDLTDFGILKSEFGQRDVPGGNPLRADIDGNGKVDLTDFGILKENFGKSGAVETPEPTAGLLAAIGLGSLAVARLFVWRRGGRGAYADPTAGSRE